MQANQRNVKSETNKYQLKTITNFKFSTKKNITKTNTKTNTKYKNKKQKTKNKNTKNTKKKIQKKKEYKKITKQIKYFGERIWNLFRELRSLASFSGEMGIACLMAKIQVLFLLLFIIYLFIYYLFIYLLFILISYSLLFCYDNSCFFFW